jgi:integrase
MGSVTPYETGLGKRYRVRYRLPDHSQTDKRGFKTKRDAELFLASVEVTKARGEFVSASQSKISLGEWAERWLAGQLQLKPSTRLGYETIVRAAIIPRWGDTSLANLTHAGLQNWLTEVSASSAPSTTRSYHRVLSMMLKYAVRDGRLSRNPADGLKLPRIVKQKHGYLTHAQLHHLASLAGKDGDLVLFLAYTGLRWGEAAALRVKDLDMLRRRVNVDQAVTEVGAELIYGTPKNHSRRSVPFPSFLTDMLAEHCEGKRPDDFVFTAPAGGALRNRNWRRRSFNPAMDRLLEIYPELTRLTPHDLRHTAASLAISAGANVKAVQKMLGHASAAMTLDVYADLFDDDLDAVGDALSKAGDPASVGKMWANRGHGDSTVTKIDRRAQ